jgi:hypothetical protein
VTPDQRELLARLLDVLVPADSEPSATEVGVLGQFEDLVDGPLVSSWRDLLEPGIACLAAEPAPLTDGLVTELARLDARPGWTVSPASFIEAMVRIANLG